MIKSNVGKGGRGFIGIEFSSFLDRPKVINRMSAKNQKVLMRVGFFGRRVIRNSMRPGGRTRRRGAGGKFRQGAFIPSKPGEPPRVHRGNLKQGVLFYASGDSVVIGAALFAQFGKGQSRSAPDLLEHGGSATFRKSLGRRKGRSGSEVWRFKARPFIAPALPKCIKQMQDLMETIQL